MTIDQQIADVEREITEIQLAFADAFDDPAKRHRLANKLKDARDRVASLYGQLTA